MLTTAYPNNFDYSDESSYSPSNQPLFAFDDPWSVGHYDMSVPHDTLPSGLDAFGEITDDNFLSDDFSSDMITDEEVASTPPPSSPVPYSPVSYSPYSAVKVEPLMIEAELVEPYGVKVDYSPQIAAQTYQQRQLYLQYQQYQYQLLQQKFLMSTIQLPPGPHFYQAPNVMPIPDPVCAPARPVVDVSRDMRPYEDVRGRPMNGCDTPLKLTNLDASHFGTTIAPYPKLKSIPVDISGNLTDAQYNKIFKKYHLHLQLDSHPTMTEQDLEDIKIHGRMYFLKNVKTIVPKVGPWKFNAHISHRRSDERQYNIPGMAVTCKVKEWLTDDGLWRLYHYKRGKTVKAKK